MKNFWRVALVAALACVMLFAFAACGPKEPKPTPEDKGVTYVSYKDGEGTFNGIKAGPMANDYEADVKLVLKSDKTFTMNVNYPDDTFSDFVTEYKGTYAVDGTTYTFSIAADSSADALYNAGTLVGSYDSAKKVLSFTAENLKTCFTAMCEGKTWATSRYHNTFVYAWEVIEKA